ncbi:hypothetical protein [Cupriavidus sp. MP-37]|uniref:hypothetical protein n=1 Tax=Cupriavidus sp. MP-37 TaxID=2884455 RepID=UPI001D09DA78|nr:hypothetical protein [Cupriavidus sp. MP-37]UDM53218.1 hypothetical protein LIN44_17975 [Cupriavidus sp. MP-37]
MDYTALVRIHASLLFASLAALLAAEVLIAGVRTDRSALARVVLVANRTSHMLAGVGLFAGLALVITGPWPLLTPWLLLSLALIGLWAMVARTWVRPWMLALEGAIGAGEGVAALSRDKRALLGRVAFLALYVSIMAVMFKKPYIPSPF